MKINLENFIKFFAVPLIFMLIGVMILATVNYGQVIASIDEIKTQKLQLADIEWYTSGQTGFERVDTSWGFNDKKEILNNILNLEKRDYVAFNKEHKLILFFCDGHAKKVKTFEIWFDVKGETFLSEYGVSSELGEFLSPFVPEKKVLLPEPPYLN